MNKQKQDNPLHLIEEGDKRLNALDFDTALEFYEQALDIYQQLDEKENIVETLLKIAEIYRSKGEHTQAIDFYNKSLAINQQIGDKNGERETLIKIAEIYYFSEQQSKAQQAFEEAVKIYRKSGDRNSERATLIEIADFYSSRDTQETGLQAIKFYQQAVAISRELKDKAGERDTHIRIAETYLSWYFDNSQDIEAQQAFEQAVTIYEAVGDKVGTVEILIKIGEIYYRYSKFAEAQTFFNRAVAIFQSIPPDTTAEADTLVQIGAVYFRNVRFSFSIDDPDNRQIALEFYQKALKIYTDINDQAGIALTWNNIGLVYFHLEQNEQALNFLQQALTLSRKIKFFTVEGSSLHNIGWVQENLGRTKRDFFDDKPFYEKLELVNQALASYQQALNIRRQIDDKVGVSDTLRNLGAIYENLQQSDKAREFYQQAIVMYKELADYEGIAKIICKTSVPDLLKSDDPFYPRFCRFSGGGAVSNPPTVLGPKKQP